MAKATKTAAPAPAPAPAEEASKGSIVDRSRYTYPTLRVRGHDNKLYYIRGVDDAVTRAMALHSIVAGLDLNDIAVENNLEMGQYSNMGQFRMALGNKLRARVKRGEPVVIGGINIPSLDTVVDLPAEEEPAE